MIILRQKDYSAKDYEGLTEAGKIKLKELRDKFAENARKMRKTSLNTIRVAKERGHDIQGAYKNHRRTNEMIKVMLNNEKPMMRKQAELL